MQITKFAFTYNQLTLVALMLLLFLGIGSFFSLSRSENPGYTIRIAQVLTFMPGASPERIDELVTNKIEKRIQEMPEVEYIRSESKLGISIIYVKFDDSYMNMNPIWDKLRRKVEKAERELPSAAEKPIVNDEYGDVFGIIIGMVWNGFQYADVKKYADELRNEILEIPNVAKVDIYGAQDERIYIEYSTSKLSEVGISPAELIKTLAERNIITPGGMISGSYKRVPVEPSGNYDSIKSVQNTLIQIPHSELLIKLSDIAHVYRGYIDPPEKKLHASGKESIGLAIAMKKGGDILSLGKEVNAKIDEFRRKTPLGIEFETLVYHPDFVGPKIRSFLLNLSQSVFLVCAVILYYLGMRTGLVVSSLIPMAVIISFGVMQFLNIGLDQVSLASLMIALGLLVDNGIVMSENILVQMELGKKPVEAAIDSAEELKMSLLISSLTTCAAFLPIYLAHSALGEYTSSLFIVMTATLIISWILSITVIPMFCVYFLKVQRISQHEMNMLPANLKYRNYLIYALRNRWRFLGYLSVAFLVAMIILKMVPRVFFPPSDIPMMTMELEMPVGTSFVHMERIVSEIESYMKKNLQINQERDSGITHWVMFIGEGGPRFRLKFRPESPNPHYAIAVINVTDIGVIPAITYELEEFIFHKYPDLKPKIRPLQEGIPVKDPVEIQISGDDPDKLIAIANSIENKLERVPGTKFVSNDWGNRLRKVAIKIDEARARKALVTHADVAHSLSTALSGSIITEYRDKEKIIPIMMRSTAAGKVDDLGKETFNIYSSITGKSVPLAQVGKIEMDWDMAQVRRYNLKKTITVSSQLLPGFHEQDIISKIVPLIVENQKQWPEGYTWSLGGETYESNKSTASIMEKVPLSIVIIVLMLMVQFNCIRKTAIIMLTIPMAMIGVAFGLFIMRSYIGFMTILGIISLAGIVINDAIVLLERIKTERDRDIRHHDALILASQMRMRPILLTTITTIMGLLPLWMSGGPMWEPMAIAIIFGLITATVLTLGYVPLLYSLFFGLNYDHYEWTDPDVKLEEWDIRSDTVRNAIDRKIQQVKKDTKKIVPH